MREFLLSLAVAVSGIGLANGQEGTLYSNGPYYNVEGTPNLSLLEINTEAVVLGFGADLADGKRIADDWIVTENVNVESLQFYAYQNFSTTVSPFTTVTLQIWNGKPSSANSTVIWGNEIDNVMSMTEFTGAYRQAESDPNNYTMPIMIQTVDTPGLTLTPGTYWVDYNFSGNMNTGSFVPPIALLGELETGNAIQFSVFNGWYDVIDWGNNAQQGFPFEVNGEVASMGVKDINSTATRVYPNPTSRFLNINAKNAIDKISVYNLAGQEVMKYAPKDINASLDVSALPKGTYILKTTVLGQVETQKFIKK